MPRITRYGLFFTALAAIALLAVSARNQSANPTPSTRPLSDWDIPELAIHLNRMGIEVRLRAVPKKGHFSHSAYLTTTSKDWSDLNGLLKNAQAIPDWHGTLYCERVGESDVTHLLEQWGDHCLVIGPFLFYGDAQLLVLVRDALAPYA